MNLVRLLTGQTLSNSTKKKLEVARGVKISGYNNQQIQYFSDFMRENRISKVVLLEKCLFFFAEPRFFENINYD